MKYRNKLDLYGSVIVENEIGEETKVFQKIKPIFCHVKPFHGGVRNVADTQVEESYTIQRIFVRKLSIKKPQKDMKFKDSMGNTYEVLDFFPNYKDNSEWEFRTRINYE